MWIKEPKERISGYIYAISVTSFEQNNEKDTFKGFSKPLKQDNYFIQLSNHGTSSENSRLFNIHGCDTSASDNLVIKGEFLEIWRDALNAEYEQEPGKKNLTTKQKSAVSVHQKQSKSPKMLMSCNWRRKISVTTLKIVAVFSDAISSRT